MYIHTYIHAYINSFIHSFAYTCESTCVYIYIYIYMYVYTCIQQVKKSINMCICIYIYIYIYIHIGIHMHERPTSFGMVIPRACSLSPESSWYLRALKASFYGLCSSVGSCCYSICTLALK